MKNHSKQQTHMELINTKPRKTEMALRREQPWALAIRAQFGDVSNFTRRFSPSHEVQRHCALNVERAVRMGDRMPSMARAEVVYGAANVTALIRSHLAVALVAMGDEGKMDRADVALCAQAIADAPKLRVLKFPTVLAFFHALKCGEYKIYGQLTTRKLMEAFNEYAEKASQREYAERQRIEEELRRAEEAEERAAAQSWDVTRRKLGLPEGTSYLDWVLQCYQEELTKTQKPGAEEGQNTSSERF